MKLTNLLLAALALSLGGIIQAKAGIIAQTDFGTTDGTNVSPFSTDYPAAPSSGRPPADYYAVAVNAAGHSWSYSDWGGVDHTDPGVGAFMVVNGSTSSSDRILYYTTTTVAGFTYTWSGLVQEVQAGTGSQVDLSFRVDGVQHGNSFSLPEGDHWVWHYFTFSYTATGSGTTTFSLNDNDTSAAYNDFGLDDQVLSTNAPAPEPTSLVLLGIGTVGMACYRWRQRKVATA